MSARKPRLHPMILRKISPSLPDIPTAAAAIARFWGEILLPSTPPEELAAAISAGLMPVLVAAANSSGGVLGKMISPQNLAIAAAAVGMSGKEGEIFRKIIGWSLGFLALMCAIVYLQSTAVLSWMLP